MLSCNDLNLGLSIQAVSAFHKSAANAQGFIELEGWLAALEKPDGLEFVMESRGLAEPGVIGQMLNKIAAALKYNELTLQDGFDAFDADQDGQLSCEDLNTTAATLELAIPAADITRLHRHMDEGASGFISFASFSKFVAAADPSDVLQSRGVALDKNEVSREGGSDPASGGPAPAVPEGAPNAEVLDALNTVAATVSFNQLTADEGYDAFDVDEDGRVSLMDLQAAVRTLQMELAPQAVTALFEHLDEGRAGAITREVWTRALEGANAEAVLKSRGVVAPGEPSGTVDRSEGSTNLAGALTIQESIDIVAAALVFNGLDLDKGYDAFDDDEDGVLSLADLQAAVQALQLNLSDRDTRALYAHMDPAGAGHIAREAWTSALSGAQTEEVLKSRGIMLGDIPAENTAGVGTETSVPLTDSVQHSVDVIAAALAYNQLTADEGYDAFDVDEDGRVSLMDLQAAVRTLQMELAPQAVTALFEHLDEGRAGAITREVWTRALEGANAEAVLKSRGVVAPVAAAEPEEPSPGRGEPGRQAYTQEEPAPAVPVEKALDIVAAALVFNGLDLDKGYDAFDDDEDGVLSLADLQAAVQALQLNLSDRDTRALYAHMDPAGAGHIAREAWTSALSGAQTEEVLKSRGIELPGGEHAAPASDPAPAPAPMNDEVQQSINSIAAALAYNQLTADEGYDAFDEDEDGRVSLADIKAAMRTLQMEHSADAIAELFSVLDAAGDGYVPRDSWARTVGAAMANGRADEILRTINIAPQAPSAAEGATVADLLAAALRFNGLSVESGFEVF